MQSYTRHLWRRAEHLPSSSDRCAHAAHAAHAAAACMQQPHSAAAQHTSKLSQPCMRTGVPRRHALLLLPSAAALLQLTAAGCLALPQPAKAAEGGVVPTPEVAAAINKAIDKAMNKGKVRIQ